MSFCREAAYLNLKMQVYLQWNSCAFGTGAALFVRRPGLLNRAGDKLPIITLGANPGSIHLQPQPLFLAGPALG